jgi:hypothetical protein
MVSKLSIYSSPLEGSSLLKKTKRLFLAKRGERIATVVAVWEL